MRSISKILAAIAVVAGSLTPAFAQNMFDAPAKGDRMIDKHGICRVVVNAGANDLMVAAKTPQEWSTGNNSFIVNIADIPNVSMKRCPPEYDDTCFFWVSGIGGTTVNDKSGIQNKARIGDTSLTWTVSLGTGKGTATAGSSMVGVGNYPDAYGNKDNPGPFYLAKNGSFDTIAIGKDTTVVLYRQKNFQGGPSLTLKGPRIVMNERWSRGENGGVSNYFKNDWLTDDWSNDPSEKIRQLVPSTRSFISRLDDGHEGYNGYPMHDLGEGSVKVTCTPL